jgi:hypothetical protein
MKSLLFFPAIILAQLTPTILSYIAMKPTATLNSYIITIMLMCLYTTFYFFHMTPKGELMVLPFRILPTQTMMKTTIQNILLSHVKPSPK